MAFSMKQKPEKIKYLTNISTLDEIHRKHVSDFESTKMSLPNKKEQVVSLNSELKILDPQDTRRRSEIKEKLRQLSEEIGEIESGINELDYYSRTNDILIEYYNQLDEGDEEYIEDLTNIVSNNISSSTNELSELNDTESSKTETDPNVNVLSKTGVSEKLIELNLLSQKRRKPKKPTRKRARHIELKKNRNILSFFTSNDKDKDKDKDNDDSDDSDSDDTESEAMSESSTMTSATSMSEQMNNLETTVSNRATLLDEYMMLLDRSYSSKPKINLIKTCQNPECKGAEKTLIQSEGLYVCRKCGEVEHIIIESEVPNHKDSVNEKPRYPR
jgi:hypothetical protein